MQTRAEEALELRTQGMALGRAEQSAILKSVGLSESPHTTESPPPPSILSSEIPKTKNGITLPRETDQSKRKY